MIDARELRIGNWVMLLATSEVVKVNLAMFSAAYLHEEADDQTYFDYVSPIPLTEEWLVKFGFKPDALGFDLQKNIYTSISYNIVHEKLFIVDREDVFKKDDAILSVRCKHVHQLQNLYFALTGEELEIKTA